MYTREELEEMTVSKLRPIATREFDVSGANKIKKEDLIELMLKIQSKREQEELTRKMIEESKNTYYTPDEFEEVETIVEEPTDEEVVQYELPEFREQETEQLSLDIAEISEEASQDEVKVATTKKSIKQLTPEELDKQRRESVAISRGQTATTIVNGKKVTGGSNKLLGALLLIDIHLLIDNLIVIVEAFFYYMWYGEKVNVNTEEGCLLLCIAFPLILYVFKKTNIAINGIVAIVQSFQKGNKEE